MLEFTKELYRLDAVELVNETINEINEYNHNGYSFTLGSKDKIVELVRELVDATQWVEVVEADIYMGILSLYTYFPWREIGSNEDYITKLIVDNHIRVDRDGWVEFYNPTKSPLYRFFLKHREGYGGNISSSINSILLAIKRVIERDIRSEWFLDKNGAWKEEVECCH